jgi:outer membrane autotransporter protein
VDAGADVTGAVDFDADGTLNLVAGATVTGAVGVSTMDQGTLNFAGAGALSSTLNAAGFELTTLSLNGDDTTVTVGGDAVAAKTNNIGNNTLNVTGTFTTEANDTLNFTVDGASSVGQVVSSGNATIDADTNVNVTIDTTEFIADGSSFTLVDGNNGGSAVADLNAGKLTLVGNSALLTFTQDTANDADLVVDVARVAVSTVSSNANTGALGGMLEANSGDAGLATVQSYIQTAATATELDERSEAVSPTADGAIFAAAAQSGAQSFSATNSRIDVARNGGADTGMVAGEMGEGLGMWAKAFGQSADQDTREGVSGYEADTYGVTVGLDSESIIDDGLLGVSFTYANTDVESDNLTSTDTDVDSYQISLYGTKDLNQGMYVSGMVGYAMNSVDQTRNNVAGSGQTANADFDGDQYMAYAEFGKDYMTNGMKITPKALVNYVHADYDGYTETGTSGANLTVGSTDVDVLELGVGVSAEWDLDDGNGNAIRPSLTAEYRYDVIGDEVQTTSSFTGGGASFKTEGFDPAQSAFLLGTGIQYDISDSVSMSADYGYQFKEDYDAHNVSIRAGVKF